MELLIKIGDVRLSATEIDILHIILDTEQYDWTMQQRLISCISSSILNNMTGLSVLSHLVCRQHTKTYGEMCSLLSYTDC
jgi:hypothetical protein